MYSCLFEDDPMTLTRRIFHHDPDTRTVTIESKQNVDPIVEDAKAHFNAHDERARYSDLNKVASIPMNVFMDLKRKGIVDDPKAFRAWLNDRDNRVFRTRPGVV